MMIHASIPTIQTASQVARGVASKLLLLQAIDPVVRGPVLRRPGPRRKALDRRGLIRANSGKLIPRTYGHTVG